MKKFFIKSFLFWLVLIYAITIYCVNGAGLKVGKLKKGDTNAPVIAGSSYYEIPEANRPGSGWVANTVQGIPGGIPTGQTHITNAYTAFSADPTGVTNSHTEINSAYSACPSNGVVYLPAGTYRIAGNITPANGRVLRGAGMTSTILNCTNGKVAIDIDSSSTWNNLYKSHEVTAGLTKGSTNVTIIPNPNMYPFGVGHAVMIGGWTTPNTEQTNSVLYWTAQGNDGTNSMFAIPRRSIHVCTATNGNTVTFWPPLVYDHTGRSNGRIAPHSTAPGGVGYTRRTMIGFEDLTIDCSQGTVTEGFNLNGVENVWFKNVRVLFAQNRAIYLANVHNIEIRGCELRMSPAIAANKAGLELDTSSFCLIENNLIVDSFPGIQNNGGVANIFGYNFIWRPDSTDVIVANHGTAGHSSHNLYEGNIANRVKQDGYFGSGANDTYFRNWFHSKNSNNPSADAIILKRFTRGYAFIGCVLGHTNDTATYPMLSFGTPNAGNTNHTGFAPPWADWDGLGGHNSGQWQELDTNVVRTTTIAGTWNYYSNAVDSGLGGLLLSNSAYLSSQPNFVKRWPLVQPTSPDFNWTNLAAGAAWTNGVWNWP